MTTHTAPGTHPAGPAPSSDDELLQHQFDDLDQQHDASMLCMWSFLATEVLFFGGLIMAYVVYRAIYPNIFGEASRRLDVTMGGINTVVLLTSSLTMALAVRAAQLKRRKETVYFLIGTLIFGTAFLVVKGFEWHHDYEQNLIPFINFEWDPEAHGHGHGAVAEADAEAGAVPQEHGPPRADAAAGADPTGGGTTLDAREAEEIEDATGIEARPGEHRPDWFDPELARPPGAIDPVLDSYYGSMPRASEAQHAKLYFVLYFFMTGLHAIHMIIGIAVVAIIAALVWTGWFSGTGETQVEVTGLYWHFVDIVWVFLYPLLYLINRHQ